MKNVLKQLSDVNLYSTLQTTKALPLRVTNTDMYAYGIFPLKQIEKQWPDTALVTLLFYYNISINHGTLLMQDEYFIPCLNKVERRGMGFMEEGGGSHFQIRAFSFETAVYREWPDELFD